MAKRTATADGADTPAEFRTQASFRTWLEANHASVTALSIRLFKVHAADRGLTYAQALDEALCFGWIDGVRHAFDADSFLIRFTPRKPTSIWSKVNVAHVVRLRAAGMMRPPGLAACACRTPERTGIYAFERPSELPAALAARFRARVRAWAFFASQPPGYRRTCVHWIVSAKQQATQVRRLDRLIALCASREILPQLDRRPEASRRGPSPKPRRSPR